METLKEQILSFYRDIMPDAYYPDDAAYMLGLKRSEDLNTFFLDLQQLVDEGKLEKLDSGYYKAVAHNSYVEGIYKESRDQFGFVIQLEGEDVFIAPEDRNTAMNNDKVRVHLMKSMRKGPFGGRKGHPSGTIVAILERANTDIVGTFDLQKKCAFVMPDDERLHTDIYVDLKQTMGARSGAKVRVHITKWPEENRLPEGQIEEILGYKGDVGLDITCLVAEHKVPHVFPKEVSKECQHIDNHVTMVPYRMDLRDLSMVTIDGEDAKDLDDAVSAIQLPNGNVQLGVHIADVSHYVRPHTSLDREAYTRGTSVYLADRVIPMLPEVLSNGLCSLNAGQDRYAMTCLMELTRQGKVISSKIGPSLIRVDRRCSYPEVYKALEEDIIPDDLRPLLPMLRLLKETAGWLKAMRKRRGALDFDFPEYKILLDEKGVPLRIVKRERTIAEQLIEECMLIANETVATYLKNTHEPTLYRIHEVPKDEKLEALQKVVAYLGKELTFGSDSVRPRDIQEFLDSVTGTEVEQVAQIMTLRSMQQAKYSADNVGHFGLASTCYTHFTSPIRRYPDLVVHRLLKKALHLPNGYSSQEATQAAMTTIGQQTSQCEQRAVETERDVEDLKRTEYMQAYVGEVFDGKVCSITSFGLFVELDNGVDGLVHVRTMQDDHYFFDEEHFLLVGQRTGKTYHLGQPLKVTLVKADIERREIDFMLGDVHKDLWAPKKVYQPAASKTSLKKHRKKAKTHKESRQKHIGGQDGRRLKKQAGRKNHGQNKWYAKVSKKKKRRK